MELHQLTEHIYYSDCVEKGDRPILGLVAGRDGTLAVDCGNSPRHASWLLGEAQRLGLPPVRWAAITHWHWDHVMGGPLLEKAGVEIICTRDTARQLAALEGLSWTSEALAARVSEGSEIAFCEAEIKAEYPEETRTLTPPNPRMALCGAAALDLGGITARLLPHPADHSMDGLLVQIPEERTVFLGDSIYLNMYTAPWHYTREKLFPLLDALEGMDARWYLPAHHKEILSGRDLRAFAERQRRLGELVGDEIALPRPAARFEKVFGHKPGPEDREELLAFIRGNLVKSR